MKTSQSYIARIDRAEGGMIYQVSGVPRNHPIDRWLGEQRLTTALATSVAPPN